MAIIIDKINYLWLDTETTGLDPVNNDVIQLACVPVVNGVQSVQVFNEYCQPTNWQNVDDTALAINHITREELAKCQSPIILVDNFIRFAKQFGCKFTLAGYNAEFDKMFLSSLFKKVNKEREYTEIFTSDVRDLYKRVKVLKKDLPTENLKLGTLCAYFQIPIKAHDALSDILATISLDHIISKMLGDVEVYDSIVDHKIDSSLVFKEPIQLHVHSKYSYTDSITDIKDMISWCFENKTPGFAVVDHGMAASLYEMTKIPQLVAAINKEQKKNYDAKAITGIPGLGLYVKSNEHTFYLSAWSTSNAGYYNLIKLASEGWKTPEMSSDVEFPCVPLEKVFAHKEGIIFGLPGVNGPIAKLVVDKKIKEIEELVLLLNSNLDIRLELSAVDVYKQYDSSIGFRSYNVKDGNIQKIINQLYFALAQKHKIKMVPVCESHFIDPVDKIIQDCVSKNSFKDHRYFFESRHQLKSVEMYTILKHHLGSTLTPTLFETLIENTYEIAQLSSTISIKYDYHLPKIDIPSKIQEAYPDYDTQTYYYMMSKIKEHGRWNNSPEYVARFKKEIDVVMKNATLNFLPYFLVYEDVCTFARASGFMQGIARGSAGGSLLSYYLKIIHVDPVASDLPFERFLSHARIRAGSFPDIDLDIADRARPKVIKYLQEKYGNGFAQIATFSKMKTKNAIKDAMYALYGRNRNDPEVRAVCDTIPDSLQGVDETDFLYGYTDQEGEIHKGQIEVNEMLRNFFKQRPEIESMVNKLLGSIRGWSRHPSAFVISTISLSDQRLPTMLMSDKELGQILVTQYDAIMVEKSGLVKADILGIKTLTMTSDCIKLIKQNHGVDFLVEEKGVPLIYRLPDKDQGVFKDFFNRDTDSSFQFNTNLIKGYAQEFQPWCRADLATMTALCRPGALDAPLYDTMAAQYYMDVRNGKRTIEYLHQDLEPILKASNGVFVYQEEIMRFLVEVAGYSWEESDIIRSAISKKKHEVIMASFDRIRKSCAARGWTKDAIETICQQIQAFSNYSFNKSHSFAYGELGYITLFLKHHYPLEWWCGVLNNEDGDDKIRKYIVTLSDKISPPSLKYPNKYWTINDGRLIAPISAIKGVGPSAVNELVSKGPFASLEDYIARVEHSKINIGAFGALIKARAVDELMDANIEDYIERRKALMDKYRLLRKTKSEFKEDMQDPTYIDIFLQEKETNTAFNKNFLTAQGIPEILKAMWPALTATGNKEVPFMMGDVTNSTIDDLSSTVLADVSTAEKYLKQGKIDGIEYDVGMILLYEGSSYKGGVSAKSGKKWNKVSVNLTDGYNRIEAIRWDQTKAFGWKQNTIVYIQGTLKQGWKDPVSLVAKEITKVEYILPSKLKGAK